ncbi:hypothetical protein [Pseudomonas sp. S2_B07]
MSMQLAHGMPRGIILFLSFKNSYLDNIQAVRGMGWQISALPMTASAGSHWQNCGVSAGY